MSTLASLVAVFLRKAVSRARRQERSGPAAPFRSGGRSRTAGMVTVELAVAIPAVVIVLAMVLGGVSLGLDQVRCVDAARLAARAVARGDPGSAANALAARAAPRGARVSVASGAGQVTATVMVRREVGGMGLDVSATSVAYLEENP